MMLQPNHHNIYHLYIIYLFIYLFVPATSGICITVAIPKLAL